MPVGIPIHANFNFFPIFHQYGLSDQAALQLREAMGIEEAESQRYKVAINLLA